MPHVLVHYKTNFASSGDAMVWDRLKSIIRQSAADELTVSGLLLTARDFSFKFDEADHPADELTKDIQFIILAHEFEERVEHADDIAERLCNELCDAIGEMRSWEPEETTVSVSLFLGALGYHASSVVPKQEVGTGSR